jgi:hypothetical protein
MSATADHVHERPSGFFAAISKAARRFGAAMVENSGGMRCARKAERLSQLSDAELARLGLTRDRIVQHAFARYLTF